MMDYRQYLLTTYSSWLGKIIGIRLGAPVENFTSDKIEELYHGKLGYLVDYGIFASDDDSNGPLFFFRSLLDKNELTSDDVADSILGYIQQYIGFFWWGGVGVSTEHTAYENLKNGIKPPKSGSCETNGLAISEQIGGQIFIDWVGYICGGNPKLAKEMAVKAACVTHDKNGIEGAIFVAVCIALAYQKNDIYEVIDEALTYLDSSMEYYKVINVVKDFYKNHDNWHDCLKFIQDNYGYDKYPGVCHIIPNSAVMAMAMLYGNNDFSKTLTIANQSGWDTDCNCGNVGSIMGALVGIDNIDKDWIIPINDIVNASSCIGYLNIQTVSESAKTFAKVAFKLNGQEIVDDNKFDLPYSTNGFFGNVEVKDDKLLVKSKEVYKYTYYLGKDIYDSRYDPSFSPILYPNDVIKFKLEGNSKVRIYVVDCLGNKEYSEPFNSEGTISYRIKTATNKTINYFGLEKLEGDSYYICDYQIIPDSKLTIDFRNYPIDKYGPRYLGDSLYNLRGFVVHSGKYEVNDDGLSFFDENSGFISTLTKQKVKSLSLNYSGDDLFLAFDVKNYQNFSAIGISNGYLTLLERSRGVNTETKIVKINTDCDKKMLVLTNNNGKINADINGCAFTIEKKLTDGIVGLYSPVKFVSKIYSLEVN